MGRIRLLIVALTSLTFPLLMWGMPVALVWLGFGFFESWWIRIICCFFAALWLLLCRPWKIFRGENWRNYLDNLTLAFMRIFF